MKECAKWQDQVGKHTKVGVSLVCLLKSKKAGGARKGRAMRGRVIGEVAKWGGRSDRTLGHCKNFSFYSGEQFQSFE